MSIKKYTNFEDVNLKNTNEGQYLQIEDFFIVTKNEREESFFGECKYDVMEVSVYDINNNLLPQKTGNTVAYIKSQNVAEYMYNTTNQQGQKELAIDAEKLLNDLGFANGILKLNINFVRNRVGSDNELERVWIQEISPSREEIRILPLKTKFENINQKNNKEFNDINNLTKDFIFYKREIINSLDFYQSQYVEKIDSALETKFGKDFFNVLKSDFGLSKFSDLRTKIFSDFRTSVTYYLENRYYTLGDGTYGKPSEVRFDDCERYDFQIILGDIQNILANCIDINLSFLKRRTVDIKKIPREFKTITFDKNIKDTIDKLGEPVKDIKVVFDGEKVKLKDEIVVPKFPLIKDEIVDMPPPQKDVIIDNPPVKDVEPPVKEIKPIPKDEDIIIFPPPKLPVFDDTKEEIQPIKEQPSIKQSEIKVSGGGGGGGDFIERNLGGGFGKEVIYDDSSERRENIK
jgi:hypothetical protein